VSTTPIERAKLPVMQFTSLPESAQQVSTKMPLIKMLRCLGLALGCDIVVEVNLAVEAYRAGTSSGGDEFCGEIPCGEALPNNG
jgi:hypothetical protein